MSSGNARREKLHRRAGLDVRSIHRQAALDGLVETGEQLLRRLALRGAARNGGDLGPEPALIGLVNHDLESHGSLLSAVTDALGGFTTSMAARLPRLLPSNVTAVYSIAP